VAARGTSVARPTTWDLTVLESSDTRDAERLGEFQELQLVARTVTETSPLRVEYALTDRGEAMRSAITELTRWAEQNLSPAPEDL